MRILIFRAGAYGDNVCITPVIRYLHSQGNELVVVTSKRGMEVLKNNPHISKLIQHKEETPVEKLSDELDYIRRKNNCEKVIDFSESIEVALSQHPRSPNYKLPKQERIQRFNRNFYEYSFEHAGIDHTKLWGLEDIPKYNPELYFEQSELDDARKYLKPNHYNVLIGLAGSGSNKCWPWTMDFCNQVSKEFPDVHFISVGDEKCLLLEDVMEGNITKLSGKISMRLSMALTSMVDLVIAPDTGIIHAAGCYDTPKMCLLGHNTKECITKHFTNDYSIEADSNLAPCSPCLYLIYNMKLQCPLNPVTTSSVCMADGIPLKVVYERFKELYVTFKKRSN